MGSDRENVKAARRSSVDGAFTIVVFKLSVTYFDRKTVLCPLAVTAEGQL